MWEQASEIQRHLLLVLAHQRITPDLVACGLTAAAVLGLPVPPHGIPTEPHLVRPHGGRRRGAPGRRSGMVGRRAGLEKADILRTPAGVLVTSPVRTVLDCARELDLPWGLALADHAVAHLRVAAYTLVLEARARRDVSGGSRSRWVARNARAGVESPLESLARAHIVLARLPEPRIQEWLDTRLGSYRVDLLDPVNRVITEADGKVKYTAKREVWQEKRREDALRELGYEVVRFTMADHHDPAAWLGTYRRAVARAARFRRPG